MRVFQGGNSNFVKYGSKKEQASDRLTCIQALRLGVISHLLKVYSI